MATFFSFKRGSAPRELTDAIEGGSAGDEEKGAIALGTLKDGDKAKEAEEAAVSPTVEPTLAPLLTSLLV